MRVRKPSAPLVLGVLACAIIIAMMVVTEALPQGTPANPQAFGTPDRVGHWTSFSSPTVTQRILLLRQVYGRGTEPGMSFVARGYRRDTGETVLFIGLNAAPGTAAGRMLQQQTAEGLLAAIVEHTGILDATYPGTRGVGGEMACGDSMLATPTTMCIWIGTTSLAYVVFTSATPTNDIAARLSRELIPQLWGAPDTGSVLNA